MEIEDDDVNGVDGDGANGVEGDDESREVRVINRSFSLGEYDSSWTRIERYLFIEIYNVIKNFYLSKDKDLIESFSDESIMVKLPVDMLDKKLFKPKNKAMQIMSAADGLTNKRVKRQTTDKSGQLGFDFIAMFPRIRYDPAQDRKYLYVRIPSEVYEEMVPIESYCQLDLILLGELASGNTIRLYEVFKSHAFRHKFTISFSDLRKQMGFWEMNKYPEWRRFNNNVLKPAVEDINNHKEYDIEVNYTKKRGKEDIQFTVISHRTVDSEAIKVAKFNDPIDAETREPNMLQDKYISTLLNNCGKVVELSNKRELREWIISDLISQQQKQKGKYEFTASMGAISKQIRAKIYKEPFAHKHLFKEIIFNDEIHEDIKKLYNKNELQKIRDTYTDEVISAHRYGYLIDVFFEEGVTESTPNNKGGDD